MTEQIKLREEISSNLESTKLEEEALSFDAVVGFVFCGGASSGGGFEPVLDASTEFSEAAHQELGRPAGAGVARIRVQAEEA